MDNYLKIMTEGTNIGHPDTSSNITTSEKAIIKAKFNSEITQSDIELIKGADDLKKRSEEVYVAKAVKVRKYQLYKNRGD